MRVIGAAILFLFSVVSSALAQANIGNAEGVERIVTGSHGGRTERVSIGDALVQNEVIQTAAASTASLRFVDRTSLRIGPSASVKLDRFTYNPDASARDVALNLVRGGFRFTTGQSDPRAFRINTPLATVGIRGTQLDVLVERARVTVLLQSGAAQVCPRGGACIMLVQPGQAAIVTPRQAEGPLRFGVVPTDFLTECLGGGSCTLQRGATPFSPYGIPSLNDPGGRSGGGGGNGAGGGGGGGNR